MSYRLDSRTEKQFKKDIKVNHVQECEIAVRLSLYKFNELETWPKLVPTGCDFTGEYIEKNKDVNINPDFQIGDRKVEVTHSNTLCKNYFHEKLPKVFKCLKEGIDLVFVNGLLVNKEPEFIWLNKKELEKFTNKAISKYDEVFHPGTGGKGGYRYEVGWFNGLWRKLPALIENLPSEYKDILNKVNYVKTN